MDVSELKSGDYVVYTNELTNYYAIAKFIKHTHEHGVYLNAAKYGGFNGKKDLYINLHDYIPICGVQIRRATAEEVIEFEEVLEANHYVWVIDHYVLESVANTDIFKKSMFGDKFITVNFKPALFLRKASNSENNFAFLYVQDYGQLQYYLDGRCVNKDLQHYNIKQL